MVKKDDNHKSVLSGGFSEIKCDSLHFPKMATIISIMSHAFLLSDLASSYHEVDSQPPPREHGLSLVTPSKYNAATEISLGTETRP